MNSNRLALGAYLLATLVLAIGTLLAAARFPGSFDWAYTVISALASRKHNPDGAAWFAGGIALAMACLWPVVTVVARGPEIRGQGPERMAASWWVVVALRVGVICGVLVGVERLVFFHFSTLVKKGHELLALIAFLSFYIGVVGLYAHRVRQWRASPWAASIVVMPLLGVGFRECWLYFAQRQLGWADYDWKGTGAPLWLSFAMWQWLAAAMLWGALGHLLATVHRGWPYKDAEGAKSLSTDFTE